MPPLPRLPWWATIIAGVVGFGSLALKAWLGDLDGVDGRFASDVFGILAGVAFATAGLNVAVQRWQAHVWKRQTAFIVFGLMEEAINELAMIAAAAWGISVD